MKPILVKYLGCLLAITIIAIAGIYVVPMYKARAQGAGQDYTQLLMQSALFRDGRLQWVGAQPPSEDESAALWAAFGVGQVHGLQEALPALEKFLANDPNSAWAPSLHSLMAKWYSDHGYYTFALRHFAAAWAATGSATEGTARRVGDFTVAHYLTLISGVGKLSDLQTLVAQAGENRVLDGGPLQHLFDAMKDWIIQGQQNPQAANRCGAFAVAEVAHVLYPDRSFGDASLEAPAAPANGFTMADLAQLCAQRQIDLVAAQRPAGDNTLVVPSVVHLSLNHYEAIVAKAGDLFEVVNGATGCSEFLSADAINAEASGAFMVPRSQLPVNWSLLTSIQTGAIYGSTILPLTNFWLWANYFEFDRGPCPTCPCPGGGPGPRGGAGGAGSTPPMPGGAPSPNPPTPGGPTPTGCASCGTGNSAGHSDQPSDAQSLLHALDPQGTFPGPSGMPVWYVSEPYGVNLWLVDEPLSYQPSRGPRIRYGLRYKRLNDDGGATWGQSATGPFFTVGQNWYFSWRSYIDIDSWSNGSGTITVHWPDGGMSEALSVNTSTAVTDFYNGAQLIATASGGGLTGITVNWPDGSTDTYTASYTDAYNNVQELFLTTRSDPAGFTTTLNYTNNSGAWQLSNITDVDGNQTTFTYTTNPQSGGYYTYISQITGPYASFSLFYDQGGNLHQIEDAAQISSYMSYSSGYLQSLQTPYGTTSFTYSNPNVGGGVTWSMQITDPLLKNWLYVFCKQQSCSQYTGTYTAPSPGFGPNTFDTLYIQYSLSFFWNPYQYENLSTPNPANFTCTDFLKGRMRHWLFNNVKKGDPCAALSLEQAPSPDGGITAGQLTWYDYDGKPTSVGDEYAGGNILPSMIAWILPDTTSSGLYYQRNVNPLGNVTEVETTYTQSNGTVGSRLWNYNYLANNVDLASIYGPNGELLQVNGYNGLHQLTVSSNYADTSTAYVTTYTYDSYNRLYRRALPSGLTTLYTYGNGGATNYPSQVNDVQINATTYFTWANGDVVTRIDARGLTNQFYYDGLHRLTNIYYPADRTSETFTYTTLDVTSRTDRLGFVTSYAYNADRQMTSITDANTNTTYYGYCDCVQLGSITNALTNVTTLSHDYAGRLTSVVYGDGTSRSYGYNALGQLTSITDHNGTTTLAYNNQGLLTNEVNQSGQTVLSIAYDIEDRPTSVTDANGVAVTQAFDYLRRVLSRTYPDTGVEYFEYNPTGLIVYTNQIGNVWRYAYDAGGRQINEYTPNSEALTNCYDAAGDLASLADGKGQTTSWGYDLYGRVTSKTNQAGVQILTYAYDADSRLTNRWSSAKGTTSYGYDNLGNLLTITYPRSHGITNAYDALNRLINMVDAAGTTTYTYTKAGDLQTETGPFASDTVTYTYDPNIPHLRIGLTLQQPSGNWSKVYGYDNGDRLKSVTSPSGTFVYTHNGAGPQIGSVNLPNATYYTNYFDSVGRQYWTTLYTSGGSSLEFSGYTYNVAGQRWLVWRAPDSSKDTNFFDNDGQVIACIGSGGTYTNEKLGYQYDTAWNLNQRTNAGVLTTFGVDSLNQLTSEPNGTPTYDGNGNLTSESSGRTFAYDDENQLTSVSSGTSYRSDFVYDGLGRRRNELDYTWSSGWVLSGQTWYIYDGRTVLQERDGNNNVVVSYTRGTDLSGSLQGAGGIGGLLARTAGASSGTIITSVNNRGSLRNDYSGWVGCYFVVGNTPLTISALGRWVVSGNTGSHSVALCNAGGTQLSGGSVTVNTAGVPPGQFAYAALSSPITLAANTGYCLMTQETMGGDQWYDFNGTTVTLSGDASGDLAVYQTSPPPNVAPASSGMSYGPVNLQYSKAGTFSQAYYHADGNGSIRVVMSSSQGYLGSYLYDAYGNSTYTYDTMSPPNTYRFSSKELHANSGLYYYGYRFYDPNLQRFLNRDPIMEWGGINLYGFVRNDAVNRADKRGLAPQLTGLIYDPKSGHITSSWTDCPNHPLPTHRKPKPLTDTEFAAASLLALGPLALEGLLTDAAAEAATLADAMEGSSTLYDTSITQGGSILNVQTDISQAEFGANLENNGWVSTISQDGQATVYSNGSSTYSVYTGGSGPSAQYSLGGGPPILKIRFPE